MCREVVRDRILYVIGFYGILLAAAIRYSQKQQLTEDKIFLDFGLAAMSLLGLIVAIFVGLGWQRN